ncbi:hypothetical protein JTB14_033357 [Gonioctena quinquepunctata]|nr:hypothetical protein JTB14_033357 [Gonioctena quinquepunctata]
MEKILSNLSEDFEITIRDAKCYIGIEMKRNGVSISITQQAFINKSLRGFNMLGCKNSSVPAEPENSLIKPIDTRETDETLKNIPYREAVGNLLYIAMNTRPEIAYAVSFVSQFCHNFDHSHWNAVKKIFRYLKATIDYGIVYSKTGKPNFQLICYTDADFGGDLDTSKSRSGYIFLLNESPVTRAALSTTEAKYCFVSRSERNFMVTAFVRRTQFFSRRCYNHESGQSECDKAC